MASTVVVSESVFGKGEEVFTASTRFRCVRAPDDEAGLVRAIRESGADHAVLGHRRYEGALYTAFAPGRVLARFGVGHDGIDKAKATAAGLSHEHARDAGRLGRGARDAPDRRLRGT